MNESEMVVYSMILTIVALDTMGVLDKLKRNLDCVWYGTEQK